MHTIEAQSLTKTYPGGVEAVKGVDFEVDAGEVFGLLGPNGAGKSTTVGMLTTTIIPTDGSSRWAPVWRSTITLNPANTELSGITSPTFLVEIEPDFTPRAVDLGGGETAVRTLPSELSSV